MNSSNTRIADLNKVFRSGKSQLLNKIARLSVLFEDLRIEMGGILAETQNMGSMDTLGERHRQIYFIRCSLITLVDIRNCLRLIAGTEEFKNARVFLPEKHRSHIDEAISFLQRNEQLLRQLRNEIGAHFDEGLEDEAVSALDPGSIGKVSWVESHSGNEPWLQLHFAHGILVMALKSRIGPGFDYERELNHALDILAQAKMAVQQATFALVHFFLWDRFG